MLRSYAHRTCLRYASKWRAWATTCLESRESARMDGLHHVGLAYQDEHDYAVGRARWWESRAEVFA